MDETYSLNGFLDAEKRLRFIIELVSSTIYRVKDDIQYIFRLADEARKAHEVEQAAQDVLQRAAGKVASTPEIEKV
ncbi:hypothetical protein FBR05_04085 [Deltaproteobacteria bacterium PRO3]|nr:hypothetical protein [Deltaproteobacteria bacterium PRO3]